MAGVRVSVFALVGLTMAACASSSSGDRAYVEAVKDAPIVTQKIGRPYQIEGRWYTPARQDDYDATGQASWYGPNFHGKPTANGERFDQDALTAAHPTLPIPSYVEVTNLDNGRVAVLRVNDRGPFARGRILDVSRRAADELGFRARGTANVRVKYLGPRQNELGSPRLYTASATQAPASAPLSTPTPAPVQAISISTQAPVSAISLEPVQIGSGWFIQAGAFSQSDRAMTARQQLGGIGQSRIETVEVGGRTFHRVLVGPYSAETAARSARYQVAEAGFAEARLVLRN